MSYSLKTILPVDLFRLYKITLALGICFAVFRTKVYIEQFMRFSVNLAAFCRFTVIFIAVHVGKTVN